MLFRSLSELGLHRFRLPSQTKSLVIGSRVNDLYLQPHIGGDIALLVALLKGVIEAGGVNDTFVNQHTDDWAAVRESVTSLEWDDLVERSGVPREQIDECVRMLCEAKSAVFMWAMGLTHHVHGVDNIRALAKIGRAHV